MTGFTFFKRTFLDMNPVLKKVCLLLAFEDGGNLMKNLFKPKESSSKGPVFTLLSSFDTSRGGESEAPTRQLARWGLLLNLHRTSLQKKSNFNTRAGFTITFA